VGLQYSLQPTRDAVGTWRAGEGNCLSFVHLFVGIARHKRLNPSYVEVEDYHRWSYESGTVISRGHIVAGLYVDGNLVTYDFLPYRAKAYRKFRPIDDLTAVAHHYNNLGAEALLADDLAAADRNLEIAHSLDPEFVKASNNLGVLHLRRHQLEEARELFESARLIEPENVPILNNLARTYQRLGDRELAAQVMAVLEEVDDANPFFYLYKGNLALHEGDLDTALSNMRRALRLDSVIPEVHVGLAMLLLATGDMERAQHHVERALKLDATHREARKYAALIQRGQREAVQSSTGG
jgi:Flp pilus assembly protein TadD